MATPPDNRVYILSAEDENGPIIVPVATAEDGEYLKDRLRNVKNAQVHSFDYTFFPHHRTSMHPLLDIASIAKLPPYRVLYISTGAWHGYGYAETRDGLLYLRIQQGQSIMLTDDTLRTVSVWLP